MIPSRSETSAAALACKVPTNHKLGLGKTNRGNRRTIFGPLIFFALLATITLWPFLISNRMVESAGGDLGVHLSAIVEAKAALAEGQFPLRVAPITLDGTRYPFFAFYGNFPYTAAALLCRLGRVNPFSAWKIVNFLSLVAGGYFAFRCCEVLTRRTLPSILSGAVFVLAPYMWIDVHIRFAFPETVAFNLLPVVLFYELRSFTTRRSIPIMLSGVAWSALALTHNIVYLYGSLFFGMFFTLLAALSLIQRPWRPWKVLRRALRVGAGYALGISLTLWFLIPQLKVLSDLDISTGASVPVGGDVLTTPSVLFSPILTTPPAANTAKMGLQIGWTVLAGALLAAAALVSRRRPLLEYRWINATLPLFALAVVLVAAPSAWWVIAPKIFYNVQSSYRLLSFVVLWGALLGGLGLSAWMGRSIRIRHLLLALAIVGLSCLPYFPRHLWLKNEELTRVIRSPDLGGNGAKSNFRLSSIALARTSVAGARQELHVVGFQASARRSDRRTRFQFQFDKPTLVQVPVLYYPDVLEVRVDGHAVAYKNVGPYVALPVSAGHHRMTVAYAGVRWANVASGVACLGVATGLIFSVVVRRRRSKSGAAVWHPASSRRARHIPAFSGSAAFKGAAIIAGIACVPPAARQLAKQLSLPGRVVTAHASHSIDDLHGPANAFDGDNATEWSAWGGEPEVTLTVTPDRPGTLRRAVLESRQTGLNEAWQKIHMEMYLGKQRVGARDVELTDAATNPIATIALEPVLADRIEFHFSSPVCLTRDGGTRVSPIMTRPGYREIRLTWDR